jgi:excisionase family DNA binding protein
MARLAVDFIPMQGNAIPEAGDTPVERDLYPVPEAAVRLGISPRTAWSLVYSGELATVWIGQRRLVPASVLAEYVQRLSASAS